ncbi:hypothetical protein PIB19_03630 [Sphingomonas sp. 7/4-4]|uniref:hypothetical protein n=1 Tax=Sphingomonas sp. 7/4-4 TaxID=3018446 RepID=UPI0022F3E154|nr:hypothetical protein [Sphingomonas sp. 7/4-4]WBY08577.1 hypothetical protein PIB19_03630 [Sphingomonas sp. 7/4-4]
MWRSIDLEIVDVAIDVLVERGIGVVEPGDFAGVARIEQADRAPREDAAVALEIGGPGAVGDFGGKGLGDVDRG